MTISSTPPTDKFMSQARSVALNGSALAESYFANDAEWFNANIPFFECSDSELEQIYYYRWKLYKAHIRDLGSKGFLITEFLDDVGWQKQPYAMLNDATGFHIYEGRWLKDRRYLDGFVEFLYPGGGNDRHFSESIADATYAYAMAKGDIKWATQFLPAMKHVYNLWDDHFDFAKGLYYIEPLLDATEYTISSVDASGGADGFRGGDAFRPSINSYMYANALAISRISEVSGDSALAADYAQRANSIKSQVQDSLWNDQLQHFTDRYQVNNKFVKYWDFIRGRELVGYVPWAFNLPDDQPLYSRAWAHLLDPREFAGPYGLRTVGPTYEHYMHQYRYLGSQDECQWNGPSWPFQTTQALLGLANLLNNYHQNVATSDDYFHLLKQYAHQHFLNGVPNLQENFNADTGKPIVGLDRSHHYNHSGFNDLIITGLVGIRPRADETLEVHPLIPTSGGLEYFCIQDVPYHSHRITVIWDADGKHYGKGTGLSVFVDGLLRHQSKTPEKLLIPLKRHKSQPSTSLLNQAVNEYRHGYPMPAASTDPDHTIWQAIDGRTWFFPEMVRGWTPGHQAESWYSLDFGKAVTISKFKLAFYVDGKATFLPEKLEIKLWDGANWIQVSAVSSAQLKQNSKSEIAIGPRSTLKIRIKFNSPRPFRLVELEVF